MQRLILELSLKPFRELSNEPLAAICRQILRQWQPLVADAQSVAFLLWASDGSEILDYRGDLNDEFEWAKWIGNANKPDAAPNSAHEHLHSHRWPYCENAPTWTYERLRFLVRALKEAAREECGKFASVGATFDPGPEFAFSAFKYERHREISVGDTMGEGQWVHCAAVLNEDANSYAGFPDGVPDGTTLGTFLGRQSQQFLSDLGFDYLWFSNGFGFSLSSWNVTGEVFDGDKFDTAQAPLVRERILRFWHDFRRECDFPVETRGSNLSTGMDLSSDASPVREIYRGDFDLVAPPNSPWAAINGDYGLELVGWLSHIAELPVGSGIPFRFYTHDPWWLNSPWLDRYGREPHDIYLPLAVARINEAGKVEKPNSVAFLTVDDSYGQMPDEVPLEVTPHIRRALADFPDAPGLVTWIYPFDEYHEWTFGTPNRVNEVFFGDWFLRAAVNQGFPLSGAISSRNFLEARTAKPENFQDTILLAPAPDANSPLADALIEHLERGGQILLYGPIARADVRLLELLNLQATHEIEGNLRFCTTLAPDTHKSEEFPDRISWRAHLCGGGAEAIVADAHKKNSIVAEVKNETQSRVFAAFESLPSGGKLGWVRGAFCETVSKEAPLPVRDDPREFFSAERTLRWMLQKFGVKMRFEKPSLQTPDPLVLAARCRGAWYFSGFSPSTNTRIRWEFPFGVPIPVGCDVQFENGSGTMALARAWHRECRVFVRQSADGEVACREQHSGEVGIARRLLVRGLQNAEVVFLAEANSQPRFQLNDDYLGRGTRICAREIEPNCWQMQNVSGELLISW